MEDFFQVLVIIGIIAVAVIKQFAKKAEETQKQKPVVNPYEDMDFPPLPPVPPISEKPFKPVTRITTPRPSSILENKPGDTPILQEEQISEKPEFDIQSAEEVRKAIIWSEILNRKY